MVSTTAHHELKALKRKHRIARVKAAWHRATSAFFSKSHFSAQTRAAIPLASLLRTSVGLILAVSGIGGSAIGFIAGHSIPGIQGALITIPVFGVVVFFTVARFAFNGSLFDEPALLQKSEQASADAERWQAEADGIADLISQATARSEEITRVFLPNVPDAVMMSPPTVASPFSVVPSSPYAPAGPTKDLGKDWWKTLPPTDKQILFARRLGIQLSGRERRGDLTELIAGELRRRGKKRTRITRERYVGMRATPNPAVAVLFNVFWPGMGQIYQGRALAGLFLMFATPLGYLCLIVPGVILHLFAIISAAFYRRQY